MARWGRVFPRPWGSRSGRTDAVQPMKPYDDYINLLPRMPKRGLDRGTLWLAAGALFFVAWSAFFGTALLTRGALHSQLAALTVQREGLKRQADAIRAEIGLSIAPGASLEKVALIQTLLSQRVQWSQVFYQFSRIVPAGLWFDSLEGTADGTPQIRIRGGAYDYTTITSFLMAMAQSGYFDKPQLLGAQQAVMNGREVVDFDIVCGVGVSQEAR